MKNKLTKENLMNAGGKLWEKKNMVRVYLTNDSIMKAFGFELKKEAKFLGQFKDIRKAKVYFNCETNTLHSDTGLVRSMFCRNGLNCLSEKN